MTMTTKWPVDFDALTQGQRIPSEIIVRFSGHATTSPGYRLGGQLPLVDLVRRARPDLDAYVRCHGDDVIIMTHEEAAVHRASQAEQGLRRFAQNHRRNLSIDPTRLSAATGAAHERVLKRHGRFASAIGRVKAYLALESVSSSKPKLTE